MVAALAVAAATPCLAVQLDASTCSGLDHERSSLATDGVLDDLHLTPDQVKALAKERLARIERYVEISGQILFRCAARSSPDIARPGSAAAVGNGEGPAAPGVGKAKATGTGKRAVAN